MLTEGITGTLLEAHFRVEPETGKVFRLSRGGKFLPAGWGLWNGYAVVSCPVNHYKYKKIRVHHLVWAWVHGEWSQEELDHINGDRSDNRISNLRKATVAQNRTNKLRQSNNKSGYKWVSKLGNRYRAEIRKNGKRVYSSIHDTPEAAYAAACTAAKQIHGEWYNCGEKK